jgi:hypothetical protein
MGFLTLKRDTKMIEVGSEEGGSSSMESTEICAALEHRGVEHEFSAELSDRLRPALAVLEGESSEALLDGVAMAFILQQEKNERLARSLEGLKEVERMMGAFSGELSKLDEVLEVLSAYVRRMRTSGPSEQPDRTLH